MIRLGLCEYVYCACVVWGCTILLIVLRGGSC